MSDKSQLFYKFFEDKYRGPRELIKTRLSAYLPAVLPLKELYPDGNVIDLGCGRGEWLELLTEHGIKSKGIDLDPAMLEECSPRGFDVECGDGIAYIKEQPESSAIVISAFHLVEHISFEDIQVLVSESLRILKPGGLLILETPNPENIRVATENFYLDPTHKNPIPSKLLQCVFEFYGFSRNKILGLQESSDLHNVKNISLFQVIEGASPDYAVIGQKPAGNNIFELLNDFFQRDYGLSFNSLAQKFEVRLRKSEKMITNVEQRLKSTEEKLVIADARVTNAEVQANETLRLFHLVINSRSWKITKPLREIVHLGRWIVRQGKKTVKTLKRSVINIVYKYTSVQRPKQIFIDISALIQHDAKTGIQRVVRSVVSELLENPPEGYCIRPVYSTFNKLGYFYSQDLRIDEHMDEKIIAFPGDEFLGLDLQHEIVKKERETYRSLREVGVTVQFVVYDLLPILHPDMFGDKLSELHVEWLKVLAENNGAICISNAVANELNMWMNENKIKHNRSFEVSSFHLGADINSSVPSKEVPADADDTLKIIKNKNSFLMVGTIEPRKGHSQTLSAFEILWAKGLELNLVIVGKKGWLVDSLIERLENHSELGQKLIWLEGISDEYLEQVYSASTCLISASNAEGFGLPLIESAQKKIPIISRDIPVFREVAGEFAFYFNNNKSPIAISGAIEEWLELYQKNQHPKSNNMPWLTWKQSTEQLLSKIIIK